MAGMLAGVECARKRRFHQSGEWFDTSSASGVGSTRRSSFCLYTSNHESHHLSSSFNNQRDLTREAYLDEELSKTAREAKERLDKRLKAHRKLSTKS